MHRALAGAIRPEAVVTARRALGLNQGELAERMGISRESLSRIESGHTRYPKPRTLKALADAIERPVSEITWPERVAS